MTEPFSESASAAATELRFAVDVTTDPNFTDAQTGPVEGYLEWVEDAYAEKSRLKAIAVGGAIVAGKTAMLGGAVTSYVYEQSPENEHLRAEKGLDAFLAAGSWDWVEGIGNRWISTAAKAAAVVATVGGISLATELVCGGITAATVSVKNGILGKFNAAVTKFAEKIKVTDEDGKPKGDVTVALAAGAAPLVVKRHAEAGGQNLKQNLQTAVVGSAGIAAYSGVLGGTMALALDTADLHHNEQLALDAIDVLSDGKTWWALYGGIIGWSLLKKAGLHTSRAASARLMSSNFALKDIKDYDTTIVSFPNNSKGEYDDN